MEYSYNVLKDDGIIQSYSEAPAKIFIQSPVNKVFMFEIRTKFKIKRKLEDDNDGAYDCVKIDSESLSATLPVNQSRNLNKQRQHLAHITYRLNEYSMPDDKIQSLIRDTLDFAERALAIDPNVPVVPIAVEVKVCTVQKDGETSQDAMDRSVRPECLAPLDLVRTIQNKDSCHRKRLRHDFLLFGLKRVRRGHDDGMDTCSICMGGGPRDADGHPVSRLPSCGHGFHYHCVVRWLWERDSPCPLCRQELVVAEKVRELKSCYARCDDVTQTAPQPNKGKGPGPSEEMVVHEEDMATSPCRPNKRQLQPSSRLKDYYVNFEE